MTQVLIVEDELKIADVLRDYFEREGWSSDHLADGSAAAERILSGRYDCVVLDLMLPGRDGLDICRTVRQSSDVPILMLTARIDEIDRLLGLELGADDYVCKPFSPREVVARVKSILRRVSRASAGTGSYAGLTMHPERFECLLNTQPLDLTPVEFRLLECLLRHPGRVYSREDLMGFAYDDHRIVSDRTIDSHIKNVRRKISDAGGEDSIIRSIYGVGYKLE